MSYTKYPKPKSCLTCRRRRKKCDLNKPHCERCLKGGFECLGYSGCEARATTHRTSPHEVHVPLIPSLRPTIPIAPIQAAWSETIRGSVEIGVSGYHHPLDTHSHSAPSILATGLRYIAPLHSVNNDPGTIRAIEDLNHAWLQSQTQITPSRSLIHRPPSVQNSVEASSNIRFTKYTTNFIEYLCGATIPPSIVSTHTIAETQFLQTINEYQLQRASYFFMTPPSRVHVPMVNRLRSSKMMICNAYLGIRLFQSLNQDPCGIATRRYIGWIDRLGRNFIADSSGNSSPKDVADRLMALLELVFLGFVAIGSTLGYDLLQKSLPAFLRLVAATPDLMAEHPNGNLVVSFPRTFSAPQNELKRFILYDTTTALVLGVSPLVEYDYDGECDPSSHGFQWVHGVPVPLVEVISQVNSWRAGSRLAPLNDWRTMEKRVFTWEPQPLVTEDEPTGNIARLAVQEGWRHVALIYIYMGICGVSSHDLRVQASIAQIVQLGASVNDLSISIHMLMHYVVAGLGARYEQHRSIIQEKLHSLKGKRVWLFRGPEFSRVLDHLWHGIGAGGAPVTWDDYVRSRCTVLPL